MYIYTYIIVPKITHRQKDFHWQIYLCKFTFFSLQAIKDGALYFTTKKSTVSFSGAYNLH